MPKSIAYLVGAKLLSAAEQDWTRTPRPEYALFTERNGCALLDYAFAERCGGRAGRRFRERGLPHVALAATAAGFHRDYNGYLVSGEDVGLPLALFARLRGTGTPIYIITHGSYFRSPKFRVLMLLVRNFKDIHFLCLAESLRSALETRFGVRPDRAHNTGYGVDTGFFEPRAVEHQPLIASAGTATRDYRTLVRAAADLPVEVRIAADSAWFPTAVDISGETLPPNVSAGSAGDYCGLRNLYASATCVVVPLYPSRHACGFAVTIEAMAMGKPVIVTRTEASSDFIIEGETGFYVPPGDVEALKSTMQRLLDNPALACEMGRNARRLIEERYSLDAYCDRMERVMGLDR